MADDILTASDFFDGTIPIDLDALHDDNEWFAVVAKIKEGEIPEDELVAARAEAIRRSNAAILALRLEN